MGVDVETLVNQLNHLHEGWKAQLQLIELGREAVEPLVRFLLSPPSILAQPRCWAAARALASLEVDAAIPLCSS